MVVEPRVRAPSWPYVAKTEGAKQACEANWLICVRLFMNRAEGPHGAEDGLRCRGALGANYEVPALCAAQSTARDPGQISIKLTKGFLTNATHRNPSLHQLLSRTERRCVAAGGIQPDCY